MSQTGAHWIVNLRTREYVVDLSPPNWNLYWKQRYPHVANEPWHKVRAYSVSEFGSAEGIPFVRENKKSGEKVVLLLQQGLHRKYEVQAAKGTIKKNHGDLPIKELRLKKAA